MAEAVILEGGSYWQRYGAKQGEGRKGPPPQPDLPAAASHWLTPNGSWQTKEPADKVFKDQHPGAWNKIERGRECTWVEVGVVQTGMSSER